MTRITTFADPEATAERASVEIARAIASAREQRGVAHLALSGGTTPARTYELLASALDSWEGVEIWFADERCVPPDDAESNYRMAAEKLLLPAAIPPAQVHRMEGELGPDEGARRYAEALRAGFAADPSDPRSSHSPAGPPGPPDPSSPPGLPVLDLVALGIGPDGHVASLFPGAPTLDAPEQALCLGVSGSPKPPPERITLSLPVLRAARRCLLLASGAAKADAIAAALGEPTHHVPASLLLRDRLTVIVDDAASPPPGLD
ncbi:MAG: 6-phosphogluconolactonase [Solirubrobacteraceae bacterium]